jgi:hypothetical protein
MAQKKELTPAEIKSAEQRLARTVAKELKAKIDPKKVITLAIGYLAGDYLDHFRAWLLDGADEDAEIITVDPAAVSPEAEDGE